MFVIVITTFFGNYADVKIKWSRCTLCSQMHVMLFLIRKKIIFCLFPLIQLLISWSKYGVHMMASLKRRYLDTNLWVSQKIHDLKSSAAFTAQGDWPGLLSSAGHLRRGLVLWLQPPGLSFRWQDPEDLGCELCKSTSQSWTF